MTDMQPGIFNIKWSGNAAVPAIGAMVEINFNSLGKGQVVGYFAQEGYLGVKVALDAAPEWYLKQNFGKPDYGYAHVFGAELR